MKAIAIILLVLLNAPMFSQELAIYEKHLLPIYSENLRDSITLELHLPVSFREASGKAPFPVIVLFDSYNENTHAYNIHSVDMLTLHGQIPESIIVGIPFTMRNRSYLTSTDKKEGDTLSGIERMERFLFEELLPRLARDYQGVGPRILLGHSRTAFLTSYLMCRRYQAFEAAGSFSGFYEPGFDEATLGAFLREMETEGRPFRYYFSAGTTREEAGYLKDYSRMSAFLEDQNPPEAFSWKYSEQANANHMTNFNLSVPWVLVDYFGPYNRILDEWLFQKLESVPADSALALLQKDFETVSKSFGKVVAPSPLHIFSIGSHYINNGSYDAALDIFQYGKTYYPFSYDMDYNIIEIYNSKGDSRKAEEWIEKTILQARSDAALSQPDKDALIADFEGMKKG